MKSAAILTVIAAASPAVASVAVNFYDTRAAFEGASFNLAIEDFESESLGDVALPNAFDSGLGVDLTQGAVSNYVDAGDPDGFGFENTVGNRNYLAFGRNNDIPGGPTGQPETGSFTVSFTCNDNESFNAFAFDLSGFQAPDGANGFNVTMLDDGQIVHDFFVPSDQSFTPAFYGFTSFDEFNEVRINIPVLNFESAADFSAFDGVAWGIPTPGATSLLALAALGVTRRRR